MINVISPRIHNLGDFMHCLPTLSGLYKRTNEKFSFFICDRLKRFNGIKELLLCQEMFEDVRFIDELKSPPGKYILIDDTGSDRGNEQTPICERRFHNFIVDNYKIDYELDEDFILQIEKQDTSIHDRIIIGDRWSINDAVDVDTRRKSHLIKDSGIFEPESCFYLNYEKELLYNCNLIQNSKLPFVTTFTGIGIVADLMKKESVILWDEDMRNWQGWGVEHDYDMHYHKNRKTKLVYIKDFSIQGLL